MKKTFNITSLLAFVAGIALTIGGIWGIYFTYSNVVTENITTSGDASIPDTLVRGPFTMKAQADVIRMHMLRISDGKTYAEMPRMIEKLDDSGMSIVGEDGKPIMIPNEARNTWVTALTLINALNMGIFAYAFSGLILLLGLISIVTGLNFYILARK